MLRLYESNDRDECLAIYRDNEVGRFPDGFVGFFEDYLDRPDYLKVVLCAEDRPVAVGGIGWTPFLISRCAWLLLDWLAQRSMVEALVQRFFWRDFLFCLSRCRAFDCS